MQKNSNKGLTTREVVIFAMLGALMFASKALLEAVPNIHPLTMLTILYTALYGLKAFFPLLVYLVIDTAKWGIMSMGPYFYIFPLCILCTLLVPTTVSNKKRQIFYTVICTSFGLFFGVLYAPWQGLVHFKSFTDGRILAWIASGFYFDVLHAAGNAAASFLILPLEKLIKRIDKR